MRFLDDESNMPFNRAWAFLTRDELIKLFHHLDEWVKEGGDPSDWHCHIESTDGSGKELTLALYDAERATGPWRDWFQLDRWTPEMFSPKDS